ncbi:MFS transporter, partial [Pseudomonas putida]
GGMLAAGVGIYMLPRFGWESMFFAAAVPLLLLPLILWLLPESVGFLVRQGRHEQARAVLNKVEPGLQLDETAHLHISETKGKGVAM